LGTHVELGAPADVAERLSAELRLTAAWLGLSKVVSGADGDLVDDDESKRAELAP
jgi:uncharacterized protein YcaQ